MSVQNLAGGEPRSMEKCSKPSNGVYPFGCLLALKIGLNLKHVQEIHVRFDLKFTHVDTHIENAENSLKNMDFTESKNLKFVYNLMIR